MNAWTRVGLVLMTLFAATAAQAGATKYSCSNVGGTEEWTIYVDLKKGLAGFFDNDSTVVIQLKEMQSLETYPPQTVYVFEGKDTASEGSRMRIRFNETKMKASVTFDADSSKAKTMESEDGCRVDTQVDLDQ